jgi:hypothetical protein
MSIVALIIAPHISLKATHSSQAETAPKVTVEQTVKADTENKL